jgi:hypothetical protein
MDILRASRRSSTNQLDKYLFGAPSSSMVPTPRVAHLEGCRIWRLCVSIGTGARTSSPAKG